MTVISTGSCSGSVIQQTAPGSALGFIDGLSEGSAFGTVDNTLITSYNGDISNIISDPSLVPVNSLGVIGATAYAFRVLLNSIDVTDNVSNNISVLYDLDRLTQCELSLYGVEFSFVVTESTWTNTLLEVYYKQGSPHKIQEIKKFTGVVYRGTSEGEYVYRIMAFDLGYTKSKAKVCLELDPASGLTRDAIGRDLLTTAGFTLIDLPPMRVYNKPFNFAEESWSSILEFFEPEAVHLRVNVDGGVEAYEIKIKDNPDHVWDVSEMLELPEITPPDATENVYLFKGEKTVEGIESEGISIEFRSTPIFAIFNIQTVAIQGTDGNIVARNFAVGSPHSSFTKLQLVKIIESEIHRIGNQVIIKIEREFAWVNPPSAQFITAVGKGGIGPDGTNFVQCFVTEGGDFVIWNQYKFAQTLERTETNLFDDDDRDIGVSISSREYFRKTKAVVNESGQHIVGVLIASDLISYDRNGGGLHQIEGYGEKSRFDVDRVYDIDSEGNGTGAQLSETQSTYGWYSFQTELNNNFILFNNTGQDDFVAIFQLIERTTKPLILDDSGRVVGEIFVLNEPHVSEGSVTGTFDWGEFASEQQIEKFRTISTEATSFSAISSSFFEKVRYIAEGNKGLRRSETFPGRPPVPRYQVSSRIIHVSEPMEILVDDPQVEIWFGRKTKIVNIRHALDEGELRDVLFRRKSRELSFQAKVVRLETIAKIGDTVLITDNEQGLFHLFVIISVRDGREYASGVSEYYLESPLFDTGLPL